MPESVNDSFYWEPERDSPLRQGDLLWNIPVTVLSDEPEFVLRNVDGESAELHRHTGFPDFAPSDEFVARGDWGALSMIITPTCHVSEGEKDEDIVALVPVQPANMMVNADSLKQLRDEKSKALHLFYLPPTDLADGILAFDAVALLDRPACFPKSTLDYYRRLGLFRDQRYALRKKLARFWGRGNADKTLDEDLRVKIEREVPLEVIE